MITIEQLKSLAASYEEDLREFRLTNDLAYLLPLINDMLGANKQILVKDFYKTLTDKEEKAFIAIRKEIGLSGNVSLTKMEQKTGLSRPVLNSLLSKMEKFGIAQIKGQGVKGTHIEMVKEIEEYGLE